MSTVRVADEVWVAAALLHRENPGRGSFTVAEIVARAATEAMHPTVRKGVEVHAYLHCVADRPPNPGRYRMLTAVGNKRRLFRPGDPEHPERRGAKSVPIREQLPDSHQHLIDWYHAQYLNPSDSGSGAPAAEAASKAVERDPILSLRGLLRRISPGHSNAKSIGERP